MTPQQLLDLPGAGNASKWCRENSYWMNEPTADEIYEWLDEKRVMVVSGGKLVIDYDGEGIPWLDSIQGVLSDAMEKYA